MTDPFEGVEIISSYTEEQAIEDGILLLMPFTVSYCNSRVNIITANCFQTIVAMESLSRPAPEKIPPITIDFEKLRKIICKQVASCSSNLESDQDMGICEGTDTIEKFWIVWNGNGYTFMLPEDY